MSDFSYAMSAESSTFAANLKSEMKHAINPKNTTRAYAFEMWMQAPMPMVTFFCTLDVSHLLRISLRTDMKFNMLMCWCIGKAANGIKEFCSRFVAKYNRNTFDTIDQHYLKQITL